MRERWNSETKKWEPVEARRYDATPIFPAVTVKRDACFVSHQLPRFWQDGNGKPLANEYTPEGKPVFKGHREVREAVARHNGENDEFDVHYGELPLVEGTGE